VLEASGMGFRLVLQCEWPRMSYAAKHRPRLGMQEARCCMPAPTDARRLFKSYAFSMTMRAELPAR